MGFPKNKKKPMEYESIENCSNFKTFFKENGFHVFRLFDSVKEEMFKSVDISTDTLEVLANTSYHKDVFRTKLGDIKQIQNLHNNAFFLDLDKINQHLAGLINLREGEYQVLNNQYFCKPPNYKMTSAHQDNAYFESNENIVTFWIPLQDVDMVNSCMFYVPKSHKDGLVEHKAIGTNVRTRTGKTGYSLYSDVYPNELFVKVPMEAFDVLIHDKNTMHFSSTNQSGDYRIAFTCIMKILKDVE